MTQPDPNAQQYVQPDPQPEPVAQPVQQPGGDLPTVGTHDTAVVGTFPNAGQPVESAEESYVPPTDFNDPNYQGLVNVKYTGSEAYEQDGNSFGPDEVRTVNAATARALVANGDFQAV